ncbi:MAG TPA: hypothetical protein VFM11_05380 [Burkholderiales bacterium]|nr:hypothetical protein [Burkholderiales bacterium]
MKEQDARLTVSATLFAAMLLLSACQKVPDLMTMVPGNADHATAPATSDHHAPAPALQPYDPTRPQPEHDFPSTRPRPGMPHPALVKEAKADAAALLYRLLPPSAAALVLHVRGTS